MPPNMRVTIKGCHLGPPRRFWSNLRITIRSAESVTISDKNRIVGRQSDGIKGVRKKGRNSIDELLTYWVDISKRQTLTVDDFALFFDRADATARHFRQSYPRMSDKFLDRVEYTVFYQSRLGVETRKKQLGNSAHAFMKDVAKNFIRRIKRWFAADITTAMERKTPLQDAEDLLASSGKLTYLWAAGIVASNHLATLLIRLSAFRAGERYNDDINTLYANLKNRTRSRKLKTFLTRSHRRFEDADKLRNRCAHVIEGEPTTQEIEQSIALARLLQKFATRRMEKGDPLTRP
jgi:hypothetical protein